MSASRRLRRQKEGKLQLFLDEKKFLQNFHQISSLGLGKDYDPLENVLGKKPTSEKQKVFNLFAKIMMAKSTKDLEDVTIDEVISCWDAKEEFAQLFEGRKADSYMETAREKCKVCKTQRKRRVL